MIPKKSFMLLWTSTGFTLCAILGTIDYRTGLELRLSLLYLIPISLVTWNAGRYPGLLLCVLAVVPDFVCSVEAGLWRSHPALVYWNSLHILGIFLVVAYLIDKRRRSEDQLKAQAEELKRSNAELEQFAFVASHDLQAPLRNITGFLQLLAKRYKGKLDAEADEFICFAVDGAARMSRLIKNLLQYSRIGRDIGPPVPVDCSKVLDLVLKDLQPSIQESGALITSSALPRVIATETELAQLFQNLLSNALKFRGAEAPRVQVSARTSGEGWLFSVQDNGIGIESANSDRIFKLFQRLHGQDQYAGTGIGLAVCKKIVENRGGRIWVESRPGEGSTFYFTLP